MHLSTALVVLPVLAAAMPGCYDGDANIACLPGVDSVGIGFDVVKGSSTGIARQVVNFTFLSRNTYEDPFGNKTVYGYPDQAKVQRATMQQTEHKIFRSVSQYTTEQAINANVDAKAGPWFSASVKTQAAWSTMKDGTHIVAESSSQVGVFNIQLDPGALLSPHRKLSQFLATLPDEYDQAAYQQFIDAYGTHFISSGTFGGLASMKTIIAQEYYSRQSDFSIQAQLQVSWGQFGGGAGGGGSSKTHDSTWSENAQSSTYTSGGDPAIKSFNSTEDWKQWVESIETTLPVMTSYTLEPIYLLAGTKQKNVQQAVTDYAVAHNVTFPAADLTQLQMSWCDCEYLNPAKLPDGGGHFPPCVGANHGPRAVFQFNCPEGKVMTKLETIMNPGTAAWGFCNYDTPNEGMQCCRPCFTASN